MFLFKKGEKGEQITIRKTLIFQKTRDEKKYHMAILVMGRLSLIFSMGLIFYDIPVSVNSSSFYPLVNSRITRLLVMLIVALSQSFATITFQSITVNRVVTPSLLGFEAIYVLINTSLVFFMGVTYLISFKGLFAFFVQTSIMVLASLVLYASLLKGRIKDLNFVLLCGIILGSGLRSISSFMRKLLNPAEYDVLQSMLIGSVTKASSEILPIAIPIVISVIIFLVIRAKKLDVLALGEGVSINLGLDIKKNTFIFLTCISLLMAISASLTGSLTFLGFLVASLTYHQLNVYEHRKMFLYSSLASILIITGSYFILNHIFYAAGSVMILIETIGGISFIITLLRRKN